MDDPQILSLVPIENVTEGRSRAERFLRHRLCRVGLEIVADFFKLFNGLKRHDDKQRAKLEGAADYFYKTAWTEVLADGSTRQPRTPQRGLPDDPVNEQGDEENAIRRHLETTIRINGSAEEAARAATEGYLRGPGVKIVEEKFGTPIVLSSMGDNGEARTRLDAYLRAHLAALEQYVAWHIRSSGLRTAYAHSAMIAEAGKAEDVARLIRQLGEEATKTS